MFDSKTIEAILDKISMLKDTSPVVTAIDGPCASGKTTLAEILSSITGAPVIHMDDFYLPASQRPKGWRKIPAGHINRKALIEQVLKPIKSTGSCTFQPFSCSEQKYLPAVKTPRSELLILEGSYSHHPALQSFVDLRIYIQEDDQTQISRLKVRSPQKLNDFQNIWIPCENLYFRTFEIEKKSEILISPRQTV